MVLKRSVARAFRLRIEPDEVTPSEARALHAANVRDPLFMAFLAWRRAVLLLVAIALVPLTTLRFVDAFSASTPEPFRFLVLIPAFAEGFLCAVCWLQLFNWTRWAKQRRALFYSWLVFMVAPFLVYLIPVDAVLSSKVSSEDAARYKILLATQALLTLAPKAVSLLAGALRAGIVSKLLFAGASGPGWLVVVAAPLYTLFVFTLLIVPYQITGSGWYVGALLGLLVAQFALGRAGYSLAKPMTHEEAVTVVARARVAYLVAMAIFAACLIAALGVLAKQIGLDTIFTTVLSFGTNALILTLIGADLIITNLERARTLATGTDQVSDDTAQKLESFVRDA